VGEGATEKDFSEFSESLKELALLSDKRHDHKYHGYEEWAACEIAFFKNKLDEAMHLALSGVTKSRANSDHGIEMMLRQYMLRIAIHMGDYALAKEVLEQIYKCIENIGKFNRQLLYDLIAGSFYIHIGVPERAAPWIFSEFDKDESSDFRVPMRELIVSVRYFLSRKKYTRALNTLYNSSPRLPHERFLFSELVFSLLLAIAEVRTGAPRKAVESFEAAYKLSYDGVFEMPFIEMGKHITSITAAVRKCKSSIIPENWLSAVERKAIIYAKNTAVIEKAFKRENKIEEEIPLSEREREVLSDMCRGLSRDEIAMYRCLSINTVKKIVGSLYLKLDASNNLDAVRIAFERKLVD
jgi:LuxR family maltose regulon positive regulatory protein